EFQGASSLSSDGSWMTYTPQNSGLLNHRVLAVSFAPDGCLWFGHVTGISVMSPESNWFTASKEGLDYWDLEVNSIEFEQDGTAWLVAWPDGVYRVRPDGEVAALYTPYNSPVGLGIGFAIDRDGCKWFANDGGIQMLDAANENWTCYGPEDSGMLGFWVGCAKVDKQNRKWFSSSEGVAVLDDDGNWSRYTAEEMGMDDDDSYVWDIEFDRDGRVWFATLYCGVRILNTDGTWTGYKSIDSGLSNDYVTDILIDGQNRKWFASSFGGLALLVED
ncbi:MAG: hypothetical protein JW941_00265, partial [Candidatus Coatesbacteria bacterium]|nr:hypothetical protein [Candidatus Coatesbacteria bacterium]